MDDYSERIKRLLDLGRALRLPPEMPYRDLVLRELSKLSGELEKDDIAFLERVEAFNREEDKQATFMLAYDPHYVLGIIDGEPGLIFYQYSLKEVKNEYSNR